MSILQPHRESRYLARVCQSEGSRRAPGFKLANPARDRVPNSAGVTPGCPVLPCTPPRPGASRRPYHLPPPSVIYLSLPSPQIRTSLRHPPRVPSGVHCPCGCLSRFAMQKSFSVASPNPHLERPRKSERSESPEDGAAGAKCSFLVGSGAGRTRRRHSGLLTPHAHRGQTPLRICIRQRAFRWQNSSAVILLGQRHPGGQQLK